MMDPIDTRGHKPRQRSARNDASMRDGDRSNGSPYDVTGDENAFDTDNDIGDDGASLAGLGEATADGAGLISVDPDRLDAVADGHRMPDEEAEYDEEELTGLARDARLPLPNYADFGVKEILERAQTLSPAQLQALERYERETLNRKAVLGGLGKLMGNG